MKIPVILCLLGGSLAFSGCASSGHSSKPDLTTVPRVDLERYMGDWHVIAHIPYFLEKGKVATTDRYALRDDGKIETTFLFRNGSFDAPEKTWSGVSWVVDPVTQAEWRVQFLWPFRVEYRVLELDEDYDWVVVSSGDGSLLWILARSRQLDEAVYNRIVEKVAARGLAASKLQKVPQPTEAVRR
jgi:apolipoprotein D and lipocalin family protein